MDLFTGLEGQLTKMKINVCETTEPFNPRQGEDYEFQVLVNPEQIKQKFTTVFDDDQPDGTTGAELRFRVQKPQSFETELVFDGTGVIANDLLPGANLLGQSKLNRLMPKLNGLRQLSSSTTAILMPRTCCKFSGEVFCFAES